MRLYLILSYLILLILHYICHHYCSQIKTQLGLNMISGQITHPLEKLFKIILFFSFLLFLRVAESLLKLDSYLSVALANLTYLRKADPACIIDLVPREITSVAKGETEFPPVNSEAG